jgi:hypothetical protein
MDEQKSIDKTNRDEVAPPKPLAIPLDNGEQQIFRGEDGTLYTVQRYPWEAF